MWSCCLSFETSTVVARWRGKGGFSKEELCGEIVEIMVKAGITHRRKSDVRTKIGEIIADYNKAIDWLEHYGSGITGDGAEQTIRGRRTHPSASAALSLRRHRFRPCVQDLQALLQDPPAYVRHGGIAARICRR